MYWHCEICDKIIIEENGNNHLQSGFHKRSAVLIIRKYNITNLKPNKIDDIIRKYLRLHSNKHEKFQVVLSMKTLIPSNQIKYFRRQYPCHRHQECFNNAFFSLKPKYLKKFFILKY